MKRLLFYMVGFMGIAIFLASPVCAKVSGRCDNCHTMHNSQDGANLYTSGPYDHLLIGGCVGCHSHATETQKYIRGTSTVPVVNFTGASAPGTYLAGGNFWWVATTGGGNDTKGHNVMEIASQDTLITEAEGAPGNLASCANSCHMTLAVAISGQDASLRGGCQGCHLKVRHHANDGATGTTKYVDSEAKGWYRFLAYHLAGAVGNYGVKGIEDSDWQATVGAGDHNEYLGIPVTKTATTSLTNYNMTSFCCGCHGNFHIQNANAATGSGSQSPWIRHPSDFVIPSVGEYSALTTYDPLSPVARPTGFAWAAGVPSSTVADGTDMVMCLSCHRPHGSPYADLLRWDYGGMVAGTGTSDTGCFYCHTTKNAN